MSAPIKIAELQRLHREHEESGLAGTMTATYVAMLDAFPALLRLARAVHDRRAANTALMVTTSVDAARRVQLTDREEAAALADFDFATEEPSS